LRSSSDGEEADDAGTELAFSEAALGHLGMVSRLARRLVPSPQDAEDLVQETYLRALQGWRRCPPERCGPWLATICANLARSWYRRRDSRPREVLDAQCGLELASARDTASEALDLMTRRALQRAIRQLPAGQREAIILMRIWGFTAAEVATMSCVPRGTVLARAHRGHRRLAGLLREEGLVPEL
jgi:RNA polymerase sigma-70 factor (ECF subfamily)